MSAFLKKPISFAFPLVLVATTLSACQTAPTAPQPQPSASASVAPGNLQAAEVLENYAENVFLTYRDAHTTAQALQVAVEAFVSQPTAEHLEAAKKAWLLARQPYSLSESFRFYEGPIDAENGPEALLNSWPLDEAYIDSVEGAPTSGIVNNTQAYPEISTSLLRELNQQGGDKNISTGYHAIEFLLWGQDLSPGPGAGQRSYRDYLPESPQSARRAQYLRSVTQMLVEDLDSLVKAWQPADSGNYRSRFVKLDSKEALAKVLRGIGTLSASELASERLGTPLDIGEREEEHSCFSDNTQQDVLGNARSIGTVLTGSYTQQDGVVHRGPGLIALLQATDAELASQLQASHQNTIQLAEAVKSPFDQEIRPDNPEGNQRVLALIQALKNQGALIVKAGQALGFQVNTDL